MLVFILCVSAIILHMSLKTKILGLPKYNIVATFFALEVFAFIAFSFGNSFILFGALSAVLFVGLIFFSIKEINIDGISNIAALIFPLIMFVLMTALGTYMKAHVYLGDFNLAENIFIPIGILSVALCGYLLSLNNTFKIKTFLIVIFSALAVLVLINLLINLVNFGPFYTLIYKNYYMYYGGKRSSLPLDKMAYALEGFKFIEVKISHYAFYPALLLGSSFMLFKTNPKTEKKTFIIYVLYSLVGLLALGFVPSIYSIIIVIAVLLIDGITILYQKVEASRKPLKFLMYLGIAGGSILFLIMLLNNQSFASGFSNIIANNHFLNRLLNTNRIVSPLNAMLYDVIGKNFLGFYGRQISEAVIEETHLSNSFFFDTFMTSGVIGVATLSFFLIYGLLGFKKYFLYSDEENSTKHTLLGFILILYAYSFFFYEGEYGVYYTIMKPFFMTGPFMISIFIFVYVTSKGKIDYRKMKEAQTNEVQA